MDYASIIIFKKVGEFDDPLTYILPDSLRKKCQIGSIAKVPFRHIMTRGIVVKIDSSAPADLDVRKIKQIKEILNEFSLSPNQVYLAQFIADYYQSSLARALRPMFPRLIWKGDFHTPQCRQYLLCDNEIALRGNKQKAVVDALRHSQGMMTDIQLKQAVANLGSSTINSLLDKGIIREERKAAYQAVSDNVLPKKISDKKLTSDQSAILKRITATTKPILLHGITGSGKTEIYLHVILKAIQKGKQAILLVPEIALTPQIINYFRDFFGDHIALFHSQLTDTQRANEWWKVKSGYAPLVIGSRSAIFAPVADLGVIILDEEHEWTYKQESNPYYQTHRIAEELSKIWSAQLIFGSATPRAESFYLAKKGVYHYLQLSKRINQKSLPQIRVVDLRDEFKKKNFSIFSTILQKKIQEQLQSNRQIILFVNQRGVARAVVCRDCGYTEQCPHCDISLKYHREAWGKADRLICHYCNYSKNVVLLCPNCRSTYIKHVGVGTQRVEEELQQLFPSVRIARADRDTVRSRGKFEHIYNAFLNHEYDVLIGTQMIAKGLDFSRVSLIGIILADIGLHLPDFRSHERLFQIITQVSGRCGRGDDPGEVILQTYNPDHFAIQHAASYNYHDFIENELRFREQLSYPPFSGMIKFVIVGSDLEKLRQHIQIEQEILEDIFKVNNLSFKIISAPAMIPKISDRYYYHVLLRAPDPQIIFKHWKPPRGWRIDVDPIHTA